LDLIEFISLLFQFFFQLFEIIDFAAKFRTSENLVEVVALKFGESVGDGVLVEIEQTEMLLEVLQLQVDSVLLHFEALIVLEFHDGPVELNQVHQSLEFVVDELQVLNPLHLQVLQQLTPVLDQLVRLHSESLKLSHDGLAALSQHVN
jgi:hypothetical protein